MPHSCFSYPSGVPAPSGPRRMTKTACFSYPAYCRYDYPADVPAGTGKPGVAEPIPPGLRSMPSGTCFRY